MKINKILEGNTLTFTIEGRLDLNSAPELEKQLENLENIQILIFDFEKLEYISSAGIRIILTVQKIMNKQGSMIIRNLNDDVREVFEITGLTDELNIE